MQRWLLAPLLLLCAVGAEALLFVHGNLAESGVAEAAKPTPGIPVRVEAARRADVPIYLKGLGSVQANNSVLVKSRVDGQIVKIDFAEGQEVHAGDLLVEIDPLPYAAALAQAQAARLKDEALLDNAKLDFGRYKLLMSQDSIAHQQLDTAASLVRQLESQVKVDQAQIDQAQVQLNYSSIRSPIDGRAGVRLVDVGNVVHASDTNGIVVLNQVRPIFVTFSLPSASFSEIRTSLQHGDISVIAQDRDGHPLNKGRLAVVDNQINQATSTITYKATFDNTEETLWPGLFVNVQVILRTLKDVLTVPVSAVQQGPDETYVFTVGKDRLVAKRPITVGFSDEAVAVVTNGLQPGDEVVTDGQYRIEAGSHVELLSPATAAE
jgi:membrane fusion protein, multidrug efflux system